MNSATQELVFCDQSSLKRHQPRVRIPRKIVNRRRVFCCMCWCCCCKCASACSSLRNRKQRNKPSIKDRLCRTEILEWATCFDSLIRSKCGFQVFQEFLRTEYSEDNLLFWLSVEEFRQETDELMIRDMAQDIYDTFISSLSPQEVSIDYKTKSNIEDELTTPTTVMFDHAQRQIYYLMYRDCYPRFLVSSSYKALL